jgi:hypothetical protein
LHSKPSFRFDLDFDFDCDIDIDVRFSPDNSAPAPADGNHDSFATDNIVDVLLKFNVLNDWEAVVVDGGVVLCCVDGVVVPWLRRNDGRAFVSSLFRPTSFSFFCVG